MPLRGYKAGISLRTNSELIGPEFIFRIGSNQKYERNPNGTPILNKGARPEFEGRHCSISDLYYISFVHNVIYASLCLPWHT